MEATNEAVREHVLDVAAPEAQRPLEELIQRMGVHAVFGEPIQNDDLIVIPVADVRFGMGYGSGKTEKPAADAETANEQGYGGGGGGMVRPRGVIEIRGSDVRYRPLIQANALALAGMALAGWLAFAFMSYLGRQR